MKIAIDLDGTLADTHSEFIREYNRRKDVSISLKDFKTYYFEKAPFTVQQFHDIARENWKTKEIPLTDENIPSHLNKIAKNHELDIVTARSDIKKERLIRWAESKDIPFNSFIVDKRKTHLDYDMLIDDCPEYIGQGMKILLYHRHYNRNATLSDNSVRVRNFEEIKKHIL